MSKTWGIYHPLGDDKYNQPLCSVEMLSTMKKNMGVQDRVPISSWGLEKKQVWALEVDSYF